MHWAHENEEDALTTLSDFLISLSRCSLFFHIIIIIIIIIQKSNYIILSTHALNAYCTEYWLIVSTTTTYKTQTQKPFWLQR